MRKFLVSLLVLCVVFGFASSALPQGRPTLSITTPNGGTVYTAGSTIIMSGQKADVERIYIACEDRTIRAIQIQSHCLGFITSDVKIDVKSPNWTYDWKVPVGFQPGQYRVVVVGLTNAGNVVDVKSDNFTIVAPPPPSPALP